MQKISLYSLLILSSVVLISGCKKDNTTTTPPVTGNLFGFVSLYDQYGGKVLSGLNNTAVTITNTSTANVLTAQTDSTSKFVYNNIVQGQYTGSFSNAGYGSISNSAFGFLGEGSIDHDVKLSAIPNFYDSVLNSPIDTLNTLVLNGTFSGTDTRKRTYVIYVGSSPAVSSSPANYLTYYTGTANNNLTTFTQKIQISDLNDLGFTSGSTIYFAVYGAATNFASTSDVEDYNTGRVQFTAISPSAATTSFVLP